MLKLDKQVPVEQFEATGSAVPSPPLRVTVADRQGGFEEQLQKLSGKMLLVEADVGNHLRSNEETPWHQYYCQN